MLKLKEFREKRKLAKKIAKYEKEAKKTYKIRPQSQYTLDKYRIVMYHEPGSPIFFKDGKYSDIGDSQYLTLEEAKYRLEEIRLDYIKTKLENDEYWKRVAELNKL